MKRRALFILLLLVAGAIVNVAVALLPISDWLKMRGGIVNSLRGSWTCNEVQHAFGARLHMHRSLLANPTNPAGSLVEPMKQRLSAYAPDCMTEAERIDDSASGDRVQFALISGRGYPMLALRGSVIVTERWPPRAVPKRDLRTNGMAVLNRNEPDFLYVPMIPIWPGFAINTVFYATILWLLLAAPFALRRRRRIKRGLCLKCAYPIGTNNVCTECGAAVQRSS